MITALVVMFNSENLLENRFKSLSFCDEIIAIDLGSTDKSVEIANKYNCKIRHHPWVPMGELAWAKYIKEASNDWILVADPDEIITPKLSCKIINNVKCASENTGIFNIPYRHHLMGKKVYVSMWKDISYISKIFHRDRINLLALVHSPIELKKGYVIKYINSTWEDESDVVLHYPAETYKNLFSKLYRYLKLEGKSRYLHGDRFSIKYVLKAFFTSCWINLKGGYFTKKLSLLDNLNVIFLISIFLIYDVLSTFSLLMYMYNKNKWNNGNNNDSSMVIDILQIEPTRRCNMHCKHCVHKDEYGYISTETFKNILLNYKNKNCDIKIIKIQGLGEPLLHPNISKLIELSHELFPNSEVMIITNGSIIPPDGIDQLVFSLETVDPVKYKYIRGYDFDKIDKNIKTIVDEYPGKIIINCVLSNETTNNDIELIKQYAKEINANVWFTPMEVWTDPSKSDYNESLDNVKLAHKIHNCLPIERRDSCGWISEHYIYYDYLGRQHPCCIRMTDDYIVDDKNKFNYNQCCKNCPM